MEKKHSYTFIPEKILKQNFLGQIEKGVYQEGEVTLPAVRRVFLKAKWYVLPVACLFAWNERRVLRRLNQSPWTHHLTSFPRCLALDRHGLIRSWIEGTPLYRAPPNTRDYYQQCAQTLRRFRKAGVVLNDTAKEANWLVSPEGDLVLVDFEVGLAFKRNTRLLRILAHEDLRHMLKHKIRYAKASVTPIERRVLKRKHWFFKFWRRVFTRSYQIICKRVLKIKKPKGAHE